MAEKKTDAKTTENVKTTDSGFSFTVAKNVTLPLLKQEDDSTVYIKITSPIYKGKELKQVKGEQKMEPADLIPVINLETGEEMEMIANTVLKSNLVETYEDKSYVGKCFAVTRKSVEGKRYKNYMIQEIEVVQ